MSKEGLLPSIITAELAFLTIAALSLTKAQKRWVLDRGIFPDLEQVGKDKAILRRRAGIPREQIRAEIEARTKTLHNVGTIPDDTNNISIPPTTTTGDDYEYIEDTKI